MKNNNHLKSNLLICGDNLNALDDLIKQGIKVDLSQRTEHYLRQCSDYGKFINDISDLHKKRLSVLSHRVKDEKKLRRAKEELEELFCEAINKAVEFCVSNL